MVIQPLKTVLANYVSDRLAFSTSKTNKKFESYASAVALTKELPKILMESSGLGHKYLIKGSAGKGNIAEVPHICIFDIEITSSAQNGYYIAYLFDSKMSRLYLSLNQGWTQYEKSYPAKEARERIRKNATIARNYLRSAYDFSFSEINLLAARKLGKGYELGNICSKVYPSEALPTDQEFLDDLRNLIGVYKELKGLVGTSILSICEAANEEEFQKVIQEAPLKIVPSGPIKKSEKRKFCNFSAWQRDPAISSMALMNASHICEVNPEHRTFISAKSGKQFVEAHHFIPIQFQDDFEFSLDVPENILSLCPNCHRAFHNSEIDTRIELIHVFYNKRAEKLRERNLFVSEETLKVYYKTAAEYENV